MRKLPPRLPTKGLEALASALALADKRICHGVNVRPFPTYGAADRQVVEETCPLAFALWQGNGLRSTGEVHDAMIRLHLACLKPGIAASPLRHLTSWWDDGGTREELLTEVQRTLTKGGAA